MPPKRKRQPDDGLQWYTQKPGKSGGKWEYKPGCIGCGTLRSNRFHKFDWAEVGTLQSNGLTLHFGPGLVHPWVCNNCRTRWSEAGIERGPLVPLHDDADESTTEIDDGGSKNSKVVLAAHFQEAESQTDGSVVTLNGLNSTSASEYQDALRDLISRPFPGNPFIEMDEFVEQYPRAYEIKSLMLAHSDQHSAVYNDRKMRHVIVSICYDGSVLDQSCDYVKRFIGRRFITSSYSDQRFLSRMNCGFHPSKNIGRINNLIKTARQSIGEDILENDPLLAVTIDDFHWCQVRAVPDTSNAPGKFTSARTTANYAVKLHRDLPPLPSGISQLLKDVLQDTSWISSVFASPETQTYAEVRNGEVQSKKMYAYSIATKAGSQEDFYVIGSDDNPMKCALHLQPVMDNIAAFLTEIDYPDKEGIFHNSFVLAGDFYVWMYASKLLRSPRYKHLEAHVLPVPDIMHVALNAQEAVLVHAWTIIHSLWLAGYPDVENTTPINMRPKRRTAMLALAMTAWQECRQELLAAYKKSAASNPEATTVRKAMVDTLIAVFEEYIPIAVDCPYLLASGDLLQIKLCLTRLFPLFALLGKKNYVNIIPFQLGLLEKLPSLLPNDIAMAFLFSKFSSEDLEVFHSILRAAIRYQDTNDQVSRKAMLITAMRGESAVKQLAAMTARENAIREQAASPIKKETRPSAPSPLEKASEDVVPRMVVFLKSLFTSLFTFSFDVVGQHGKTPYTSDVPHYKLIQRPLPSSQPVTSAEESPEVILATIRESLVPLQLRRQTFVNLGNHVDVESFQTVPLPIAKNPLGDITNLPSPSSKTTKKPVRDFLSTTSLEYDLARCGCFALACQCSAMYQSIGTTSLEHFLKNIDKDVPRDSEGKPDNDVFRAVSLAGGRSTSHRFLHPI